MTDVQSAGRDDVGFGQELHRYVAGDGGGGADRGRCDDAEFSQQLYRHGGGQHAEFSEELHRHQCGHDAELEQKLHRCFDSDGSGGADHSGRCGALSSANTYTDAETTRATAAEATKANLAGGNIFTGGSQKLTAATGNYSSLNIASGAAPDNAHVAAGDVWLTNADSHLQFQDASNTTQSLAFVTDVQSADATTLTSAKSYTDASLATEAAARIGPMRRR